MSPASVRFTLALTKSVKYWLVLHPHPSHIGEGQIVAAPRRTVTQIMIDPPQYVGGRRILFAVCATGFVGGAWASLKRTPG